MNASQHPDSLPCAFRTDGDVALPESVAAHQERCGCLLHARRRLGGALIGAGLLGAAPGVFAQQRVPVQGQKDAECKISFATNLAPSAQIEQAATQQYAQMIREAQQQQALAPQEHPQVQRLRYIAQRLIPFTPSCNPQAARWDWQVNLLGSPQLNAFCMPGGKIAFFYGILDKLQLSDDEVAQIMGHEISHALLEHARERMGKTSLTRGALEIGSVLLGLGDLGRIAAGVGGQLLSLKFSRSDESEADSLGMLIAARAGYNPEAGVTLWKKMIGASKGAPPAWLSTHPTGVARIEAMQKKLPKMTPIFQAAAKPDRHFGPPKSING